MNKGLLRPGPILAPLFGMKRFNPKRWLRERPIDFALALVILVVCLTVAVYQYRAQESAPVSAGQLLSTPMVQVIGGTPEKPTLPG